jgi:sigma-B regulation protein RsbU (phosphoserine phosphatase)
VTVVANWIIASTTGYALLGSDLFTILFVVFLVLVSITLIRPIMRKVLWRVRNRLFVTYFLIGVLPIVLMLIVMAVGIYASSGAIAAYLAQSELALRIHSVGDDAQKLADDLAAGRRRFVPSDLPVTGVARSRNRSIASESVIRTIPTWSRPGFQGLVRTANGAYFLAADAQAGQGEGQVEAFVYTPFDDKAIAKLIPGYGRVAIFRAEDFAGRQDNIDLSTRPSLDSNRGEPFIFGAFGGFPLTSVRDLDTGDQEEHGVYVSTTPSLIANHVLNSTLGSLKSFVIIGLLTSLGGLLFIELLAVASSVKLTRTLTRTVHDLYLGTKKVEAGDFSHRIPVRTKDQLSDLASSFNAMTQRVEQLIVEVKEKERLESELEIARQVQAQLFPREIPKLEKLELVGICNPARIVSGDYYDFIPVDSRSTALVIGDISGKGISAALLMASLQSSLHAQLTMQSNGALSVAKLVARLNRQLFENTAPEKYATFYCGLYDDQTGALAYTNAGHLAPILLRGRNVTRLESNGMVVGMFPDSPYEENALQLQTGDLLTAFTDGITECENARQEQFGEDRLTDLLIRHHDRPLDEIVRAITDAVRDWAGDIDKQDDTTLLLARRL